jgi:hypothetical protein
MTITRLLKSSVAGLALVVATAAFAGPALAQSPAAPAASSAPASGPGPSATDPVATVNGLVDTMLAKDFSHLGDYVCADKKDLVTQRFDIASAFGSMPSGVDVPAFVAGLTLTVEGRSATLVSSDASNATVKLAGTLHIAASPDAAKTFVTQILQAQGMEVTDAILNQYVPVLMSQIQTSQDLATTMTLTVENGVWLVCGGMGLDQSPAPSGAAPAASASPQG